MTRFVIIDELHEIKRSGVYYSTESLRDMYQSAGLSCDIIGIKKRSKLFNSIICIPFIREFLFFPIWNWYMVRHLEQGGYSVAFYQCSTALFLIRNSGFKRVVYTRALLARRLGIYLKLRLPFRIKLALAIAHPFIKFAEGVSFRNADRVVASKQRFAEYIAKEFHVQKNVFHIVPQMIDIHIPKNDGKKKYDLLFIGRLSPPKNWDMIEAIARHSNYTITAATPEMAAPKSVPHNITILHRVPYDELGKLINEARIFIMPSHNEEGPRVTLEAMAAGLPVVASIEGGGEFVENNKNGLVVVSNEVEDYLAAIKLILSDKKLYAVMAKNNPPKAASYRPKALLKPYIKAITF